MSGVEAISDLGTTPLPAVEPQVMGRDDFLKLLIVKIQAQDPLNPMDETQFTEQLTQFSQLEQLMNANDMLTILQYLGNSSNNAQFVGFIGKEVKADGNTIELFGDESAQVSFDLQGEAEKLTISIYDENGDLVRVVEDEGPLTSGEHSVAFDGLDDNGVALPDGVYTFKVAAEDIEGENVPAQTLIRGVIDGITYEGDSTMLLIGSMAISIGDILKVMTDQEGGVL